MVRNSMLNNIIFQTTPRTHFYLQDKFKNPQNNIPK